MAWSCPCCPNRSPLPVKSSSLRLPTRSQRQPFPRNRLTFMARSPTGLSKTASVSSARTARPSPNSSSMEEDATGPVHERFESFRRFPRRGETGNSRRRTGLRTGRERRFEPQSARAKPKSGNPGSSDASTKVLSRQLLLRPIAASLPLPHVEPRSHRVQQPLPVEPPGQVQGDHAGGQVRQQSCPDHK